MIAQPTTAHYLLRRLAAYLIDSLILFAGVLITQAILYLAGLNPIASAVQRGTGFAGWQLHLWVFATASVPLWLYFAASHSSGWRATPGKRLFGLRVLGPDGGRLSFGRALTRAGLTLIPFEMNHAALFHLAPLEGAPSPAFWSATAIIWLLILAYLGTVLATPDRQSPPDLIAGSRVAV